MCDIPVSIRSSRLVKIVREEPVVQTNYLNITILQQHPCVSEIKIASGIAGRVVGKMAVLWQNARSPTGR
jgi:hypothetical protein